MTLGEAIFTQRSIRRFRPDPIPIPDIRLILEAAVRAPNGGNQQVARFLVVHDPKTIRELGGLYHECRSVCGVPVQRTGLRATVVPDRSAFVDWA
jgi:nitroreductase